MAMAANSLASSVSPNVSCYGASRETLTDNWRVLYHPDFGGKAGTGPLILLFITGIPLNLYIVIAILYKRLYTQPTYLLLLNLGIIHLITCFIPILFGIVTGLRGEVWFGSSDYFRCQLCKIVSGYLLVSFAQSFNMALLSLERLAFFLSPLRYKSSVTYRKTGYVLVFMWLLSFGLTLPPILGYGDLAFAMWCGFIFLTRPHVDSSVSYLSICVVVGVILLMILVVSNIWIAHIAIKSINEVRDKRVTPISDTRIGMGTMYQRTRRREMARKQLRLFQIFGILLLVSILAILPAIFLAAATIINVRALQAEYLIFVQIFQLAQVALHPAIETSIAPELRRIVVSHCLFCCPTKLRYTVVGRCLYAAYIKLGKCCRSDMWTRALEREIVNVYEFSMDHGARTISYSSYTGPTGPSTTTIRASNTWTSQI